MATFSHESINEWKRDVQNDVAEFIGAEFCGARLIGNICRQLEHGELTDAQADQLLKDARHLTRLAELGQKYANLAHKPAPEMHDIVLLEAKKMGLLK